MCVFFSNIAYFLCAILLKWVVSTNFVDEDIIEKMIKITEDINDILDLGYSLSTEKYYQKLFDILLNGCMKYTGADSGALYIVDKNQLQCLIHVNKTLDAQGKSYGEIEEHIDLSAHNMLAYTAAHRSILRIDNIAEDKRFDALKIKEFDAINGYLTKSLMVVPVFEPNSKVIGVMLLINCVDELGNIVGFPEEYEKMASSLTSQMAVTLTNMTQIQDLDELLNSFVECMTTAIDARTPYNANHTRNVAEYCMEICDYINALHTRGEFNVFITQNDKDQLFMAAMLHDLGKMITPREVLNKATRLGSRFDGLMNKLEKISLMMKIDMLEGRLDSAEWAMTDLRLSNFRAELPGINIRERLTDSDEFRINDMAHRSYVDKDGYAIPYLDEEELKALSISKGTLTVEERQIVEQHVVYTDTMLDKIKFNEKYNRVRRIAASHHEYLDGSGYPNHIKGDQIDILTRILTIIDIYDSLTANDRPYKGTMPVHRALEILDEMAKAGKLDAALVRIIHDYMRKKVYG